MYKCDICNRPMKKKIKLGGYVLCSKHMHQLHKYGKFLDNNPRTIQDLNEYRIEGNIAIIDVYNVKNEKVAEFIIDREDLKRIKYLKWRIDSQNRIKTGNHTNTKPTIELARMIMNCRDEDLVVDHINGNLLDNRKTNLRICIQSENVKNQRLNKDNTSEFTGVSYDKARLRWTAEIRNDDKRTHLKRWKRKSEAVYARYVAEQILYKEFRNTENDKKILESIQELTEKEKQEIEKYVTEKLSV